MYSEIDLFIPLKMRNNRGEKLNRVSEREEENWISITAIDNLKITLLKSTGYVMHQQFNIQQLYVLPTLYLCVLYLSENRQRLVPLTA